MLLHFGGKVAIAGKRYHLEILVQQPPEWLHVGNDQPLAQVIPGAIKIEQPRTRFQSDKPGDKTQAFAVGELKKSLIAATTASCCALLISGKIGRLTHSRAALSATGKSPGL